MRGLALALGLFTASCASTADDSELARTQRCEQIRNHLVDLRFDSTHVDVEVHREAMRQALGDQFIERCVSKLTAEQIRCALAATESAQALRCTRADGTEQ